MKKIFLLVLFGFISLLCGCEEYEIISTSGKPFEPIFVFKETAVFDFSVDTYDEATNKRVNVWYIYNKDEKNLIFLNKIKYGELPDGFIQKWKYTLKPGILYSIYLTNSGVNKTYSGKFYIKETKEGYEILKNNI